MKNLKFIAFILGLLLFSTVANAQSQRNPCYDPNIVDTQYQNCVGVGVSTPFPVQIESGGNNPGAGSQPYNYTPLTPGQYGLSITSSTPLTIPTGALQAVVCAAGNNVNYTYDGTTTPTALVGLPLLTGQCIQFSGATVLANLKFIQTAATATLNVGYTK